MSDIKHGDPVWMDLSTHDIDAAQTFYRELLGWEFASAGEDFGGYLIISSGGRQVGGAMSSLMGPEGPTGEPQSPTTWTVYLKADDIAATVKKAAAAGGTVLLAPMKVGSFGMMAVIADPAGAVVGLWQADEFHGLMRDAGPGTPPWFEVMTMDFDAAVEFYREVAGWETGESGEGVRYASTDAAGIGEANSLMPAGTPSFWRMYVEVADVDAGVEKLRELGGELLDGPVDSPFGRIATVADPQGASFQLISR
ncbi:VOC family protein [Corynebacterium comes]|uniref:27 kDa antigen Cfp30B n=1 Tax=Corynebacterium comes TaxID=2675218 RepID=A0A6B8VKD4_9CORY|nr:VOC family protein [Corynebacterium comes]QGU03529.1 27 kDa antigen Cfp30B [Corynebacterium comes]